MMQLENMLVVPDNIKESFPVLPIRAVKYLFVLFLIYSGFRSIMLK